MNDKIDFVARLRALVEEMRADALEDDKAARGSNCPTPRTQAVLNATAGVLRIFATKLETIVAAAPKPEAQAAVALPPRHIAVPIALPALAVSAIKDMLESEYNMPSVRARPLWASLLEIVSGLTIEQQEAINEAAAAAARGRRPS